MCSAKIALSLAAGAVLGGLSVMVGRSLEPDMARAVGSIDWAAFLVLSLVSVFMVFVVLHRENQSPQQTWRKVNAILPVFPVIAVFGLVSAGLFWSMSLGAPAAEVDYGGFARLHLVYLIFGLAGWAIQAHYGNLPQPEARSSHRAADDE